MPPEISLEQLCRALAAHVMFSSYSEELHGPLAPERAEAVAKLIHGFALGEAMPRPAPPDTDGAART